MREAKEKKYYVFCLWKYRKNLRVCWRCWRFL